MKRIISALVLVTLSIAACGDDDDGGDNTGGTGGSSQGNAGEPSAPVGGSEDGAAGTPNGTAGMPGGTAGMPSGNVGCDPDEATTCQNAMDCPVVVDGTARIKAGECGQGCIGQEESCAVDCITMEVDISEECASCYAQTVNCTIENCISDCLADPEADKCKACQVESGCREEFNTCSGLPE